MSTEEKDSKLWKPPPALWMALLGVAVFMTFVIRANLKAAHIEDVLRGEFSAIASPPGVTLIGEESLHKPGVVFVGHTYAIRSDFNSIREFYERELPSRGWVHNSESRSGDELVIEYCKQQYATKIDYFVKSEAPARYTLYLDWGINNCR
jgi:hypothetical protein